MSRENLGTGRTKQGFGTRQIRHKRVVTIEGNSRLSTCLKNSGFAGRSPIFEGLQAGEGVCFRQAIAQRNNVNFLDELRLRSRRFHLHREPVSERMCGTRAPELAATHIAAGS